MENMDKKEGAGDNSNMGWGMYRHHGRHHLVKMILKLIIVIIIFWCGFKLGEMIGYIRAEGGYATHGVMMRGGMMGGNYGNAPMMPATTTSVTPAQ